VNHKVQQPIVLFDGICNLCCGLVEFIIRRDRDRRFRFVPLQSEPGKSLQREYRLDDPRQDAIVLIDKGSAYIRSTALLKIFRRLGGAWRLLSLLIVLPSGFRDAAYTAIAKNRYRLFGKRDACLVPSRDIADRFKTH
jgi:predicted DCC family thiol-disulfide oxidoreductase YuxK